MGPNEDREQRIHDAKMERLAGEANERAALRAEILRLDAMVLEEQTEKAKLLLQVDGLQKQKDEVYKAGVKLAEEIHKCWMGAEREKDDALRLNGETLEKVSHVIASLERVSNLDFVEDNDRLLFAIVQLRTIIERPKGRCPQCFHDDVNLGRCSPGDPFDFVDLHCRECCKGDWKQA